MTSKPRDLFSPVVSTGRLDHQFKQVAQGPGHEAAKALMNAIFENLRDVDHSFVQEFQTGGFSARVFELAVFAYLEEQNLQLDRTAPAPDFVLRGIHPVAIEVTTSNPRQDAPADDIVPTSWVPPDLPDADREFVFQLGKALRRKLTHRDAQGQHYWEKRHVTGLPFVIAVGAFHNEHAQFHPEGLLAKYLYGLDQEFNQDDAGNLTVTPHHIIEHQHAGKTIPSALFRQTESANLSGVLFSNALTMAKFNRIGTEQGLGHPQTALVRYGTCYNYAPNALTPNPFAYVVGDRPDHDLETFSEGLHLFINPWATVPLSPEALPDIVVYALRDDGILETTFPTGFRPFVSKTNVFTGANTELIARYFQRDYLGQLPPGAPSFGEIMSRIYGDWKSE